MIFETEDTYRYAARDAKPRFKYETYLEEYNKNADILSKKKVEVITKCIIAPPGQVEELYNAGIKEYMNIGGNKEIEEKKATYIK